MRKLLFTALLIAVAATVSAEPLTKRQLKLLKDEDVLVSEMGKMLDSIGSLDAVVNRHESIDYTSFKKDAERILEIVKMLRDLDDNGIFKTQLDRLEMPAKSLRQAAMNHDPNGWRHAQEIADACFRCHAAHRGRPGLE